MDKELKDAVLELIFAQKQTTKNVDELRKDIKGMVDNIAKIGVLESKINSAHRRIDDIKADDKEQNAKAFKIMMLLITTLISSLGAMLGVVFLFLKGG